MKLSKSKKIRIPQLTTRNILQISPNNVLTSFECGDILTPHVTAPDLYSAPFSIIIYIQTDTRV